MFQPTTNIVGVNVIMEEQSAPENLVINGSEDNGQRLKLLI